MLGIKCTLARGNGNFGESLTPMDDVTDATLNMPKSEATATTRGSYPFEITEPILIQASIDFTILAKPGSADLAAVIAAAVNNTPIELAALDGDLSTPGSAGLHAMFKITSMSRPEPLNDLVRYQFTAKPCLSSSPIEWMEVE